MKYLTIKTVVMVMFILVCISIKVQAQNQTNATEEVLTNETIITLTKAGLSPTIIVNKIRTSKTKFNVSTEELLKLKKENVADDVVNVMLQTADTKAKEAEVANTPAPANPNDPTAPHDSGIYLLKENDNTKVMIQMDPSVYTQAKSGGFFKSAMTYGIAKVKSKAVLAGRQANLQMDNAKPVFYFYFDTKSAGLSSAGNVYQGVSVSPNEFVLVKMDVKKNSRELVVGQFNSFGASSGALDEFVQPFDYEKVAPGIYKVTPKKDLKEGEYGFFYGGTTPLATYGYFGAVGGSKIFDFGIKVLR